jgi:putative Ig domain-containing protein
MLRKELIRFVSMFACASIATWAAGCGSESPPGVGSDAGSGSDGSGSDGASGNDATTGAFRITTTSLPPGMINVAYSASIQAEGGEMPYRFAIVGGSALPNGLTFTEDGKLSGTPLVAGGSRFTVQATDGANPPNTATQELKLVITPAQGTALSIDTMTLPDGQVGMAYSAPLLASGGATPYAWSVASGALPGGIALSIDGMLTGTPTAAGSATFSLQVADNSAPNQIATASFTLSIKPATPGTTPLSITTASLPDGKVGTSYTAMLGATGGTAPYTWSLAAGTTLPSGLLLDSNGAISGTPSQAGLTTFSVQVLDASTPPQVATVQLSINVQPATGPTVTPLSITTMSLPNAMLGQAYTASVAATGGTPPYAFSVGNGNLPPGLSMSASGAITGVPAMAGVFSFSVQASDASMPPQVASRSLSITVIGTSGTQPLQITTTVLPDATVGANYMAQLSASGGTSPYRWAVDPSTMLPPGLTLLPSGALTGVATTPGRYSFTVIVGDASNPAQTASAPLSITVLAAPGTASVTITTGNLPSGVVGIAYSAQLTASGGMTPYTWTLVSGMLPSGFTLSSSGLISGTTAVAGTFGFTIQVADASNPQLTAQATFTLTINPRPGGATLQITTTGLPPARTRTLYKAQLAASGGTTPYAWSISAGRFPSTLTLTSTGAIVGTPTVAASYTFTVQVTDASNPQQTAQRQLTLTVLANPAGGLAILTRLLPPARVDAAYMATLAATGGTRPFTWSISAGTLPQGLTLDAASGRITGTASVAGSYTFTAQVTDSEAMPETATRTFTITVTGMHMGAPLRIDTATLPQGTVNMAYSFSLAASGGTAPYTWSLASGTLPAGIMLAPDGTLSGTPTTMGTSRFTVQVTDSATPAATSTRMLDLVIRP